MSKISGQFLISGQFQDSFEISGIPGISGQLGRDPEHNTTALQHMLAKHHIMWCRVNVYLPLRLGVSPKKTHSETDIRSDAKTVIIALSARPHLDLTISILPASHTTWHSVLDPTWTSPSLTYLHHTPHGTQC